MTSSTPVANYINHIGMVGDASYSMNVHASAVVKVMDNTVAHLAERSQFHDQETRVTFYDFADRGDVKCRFYDKDVLRMPSIAGLYRPRGNTALIDAALLAIREMEQTAQLHGEHAFLLYLFSDGQENDSRARPSELSAKIASLPSNWTVAAFAPNQQAVFELKRCGFPADNIAVWDTTSTVGMEKVGEIIRATSETFMEGRKHGVHGYSASSGGGLFKMREFSAADVKGAATPMTDGSYFFLPVSAKERIDEFVARETKKAYVLGRCYYQFMKTETIQPQKAIAVEVVEKKAGGPEERKVYTGPAARVILGLPTDHSVKVRPDQKAGCTIFIQSTSYNRNLIPGTRLLVLR